MSDEAQRQAAILQIRSVADREGAVIPLDAASYLAGLEVDEREREGLLMRLIAYASLRNEDISLSLVKSVVARVLEEAAADDPIVH